jgi:hypothetical protein
MYFEPLSEAIDRVPVHFVYNMAEMGHQKWANRQEKVCYIPSSHGESHVYFPVPRTGKRITLIGCIGADGSFLEPLIVIPRARNEVDGQKDSRCKICQGQSLTQISLGAVSFQSPKLRMCISSSHTKTDQWPAVVLLCIVRFQETTASDISRPKYTAIFAYLSEV